MSRNCRFERAPRWLLGAAALVLAGCGGGGDGDGGGDSSGNGISYCSPTATVSKLAPGPAWLPYTAQRRSESSLGQAGILVVPTANLAVTPVYVDTDVATSIDAVFRFGRNAQGRIESGAPAIWIYKTDAGLYRLNLESIGAPARTAISSFAGPAADICAASVLQTHPSDPSTGIVLMRRRGVDGVCGGVDRYQKVRVSDGAETAPTDVPIKTTAFTALYQASGAFGGFLGQEGADLVFYPNADFSGRTVLKSGIGSVSTYAYNGLETIVGVYGDGVGSLYHVGANGVISNSLHAYIGSSVLSIDVTPDGQFLIFVDARASGTPVNAFMDQRVGRIPIDGSAPATILYSASGSADDIPSRNLLTVTDSRIVVLADPYAKSDVPAIETWLVDRPSSPKTVYRAPSYIPFWFVAASGDSIFLNAYTEGDGVNWRPRAVAIDVVGAKHQDRVDAEYIGTVGQIPQFLGFNPSTANEGNTAALLRVDQVAADVTWSGSTVTSLNFGTCQATTVKNPNGSTFTFPTGYYTGGFLGYASMVSGTVWQLTDPALNYQMDAIAFDLNHSILALVTQTLDVDESH